MFNIQKQGSSLLITSSDNTQFPYKDGKMSIPMNSITYVIDESNYIAFRSASNNDILFSANIDDIQINGSTVGKDDFILTFDAVANSTASGGGGTASAGVNSLNGFQGDLTLKTINGKNIIGSGDITIEGGGEPDQYVKMLGQESSNNLIWYMNQSDDYREIKFKTINGNPIIGDGDITIEGGEGGSAAGVEAINIGREVQDWTQKTGIVTFSTEWYDGSYDVGIDGTTFFGIKPLDDSIILEYAGGTVNGNSRCGIKVKPEGLGLNIDENNNVILGKNTTTKGSYSTLIGNNITNLYNASVLIGQGVSNTVGDKNNLTVNICNTLMGDANGDVYIWKDSKVQKLQDLLNNTGGGDSAAGVNKIILGEDDYGWNVFSGDIKLMSSLNDWGDEGVFYDVRVGANDGSSLWFGFTSSDKSIKISDNSSRIDVKVNEWIGTQDEYDALGEYDSNCTYYITE